MSGVRRTARVRAVASAVVVLAASGVLVATDVADAVDPAPVVDSTTAVLDADLGNLDGVTSLADAIWLANTDAELDTITFDLDPADLGPIDTVNVPPITDDVIINGPGRERLTLTQTTGDVLRVENGADVTLADIAIDGAAGGFGPFDGLVLDDFGSMLIRRVDISNVATGISGSQMGLEPSGLFNAVDLTISGATGSGMTLLRVSTVLLDEVVVSDTAGVAGIDIDEAGQVNALDTAVSDGLDGFSVRDVGDVQLLDVVSSGNDGIGVELRESYGTIIASGADVSDNGGVGILVDGSGAMPPMGVTEVRDVEIESSSVSGNDGGGISIEGSGDITLGDLEVIGNGVAPASGLGGIFLGVDNDPSIATLEGSTISDNFGDNGGGITTSNHDGEFTIRESTITGNQAAVGTAMRIASVGGNGLVVVERSVISGHTAGTAPTVYDDGVAMRFVESNITDNAGDALFHAVNGNGISIRSSTITANTFDNALFENGAFSFLETIETTATGNTGAAGAGVFRRTAGGGQLIATNTVLSGNGVGLAAGDSLAPSPAVTYSVVPTGSPAGTGNVVADDPGIGALIDNGGPLPTMLPRPTSPAVDAGDPAGSTIATTLDQRGLDRIVNGRIDIGSVERQESPFVIGLPPARILETRSGPTFETVDGQFEGIGRRTDGSELRLEVSGRAGVPADAEAVVVNITAVAPTGVGFVTAHPCLVNPPLASSLNFRSDVDSGNEIVAQLDAEGDICLFNRTTTDLVVDVVGYVPADSRYTPVGPARLLDTRFDAGDTIDGLFEQGGIRQSDTELALDVAGRGGVSDDAVAVVVNVTAVKPVSIGYVTVHPCLPEEPTAASLNFEPGVNRGNEIVAQLDDQGRICLYTFGSAELVVDVVGQLTDENVYEPVPPARLIETREVLTGTIDGEQEAIGRLTDRQTLTVRAGGRAGVPAGADSVIVNVTAIRPDLRGFITVWDCAGAMPLAASLNYITGEIVGNELVVALDDDEFCVFTNRATDLTVDVVAHLS